MYFDIKIRQVVDDKAKVNPYIIQCDIIEEVFTILAAHEDFKDIEYTVVHLSEAKYISDYVAEECGYYWKVELVFETIDGKDNKELYVVEGEHMNKVRDKLIESVEGCSIENFKKHDELKILEII